MMTTERRHASATGIFESITAPPRAPWGLRAPRRRPPRQQLNRVVTALVWLFSGLAAVAVYMNVMADDSDLRLKTEALARERAGCSDRCRITTMQGRRSVVEYSADYSFDGHGEVHVVCRRAAIVLGEHHCTVH
ncbi:MAG: hypothetical protein K0S65_1870 [Labilithrix sp.]|nr:hypothetical protein [Labilithrix sp.]